MKDQPEGTMTPQQLADYVGAKVSTVRCWSVRGWGPRFTVYKSRKLFDSGDIELWKADMIARIENNQPTDENERKREVRRQRVARKKLSGSIMSRPWTQRGLAYLQKQGEA